MQDRDVAESCRRVYEIRTFPNVSKRRETSETPQKSKVLLQVLTRISLKGLNRWCETGMSLNRLNRVCKIKTFPQRVQTQENVGNTTEVPCATTSIDKDSP